ncbi:MAG: TolB family protein, partial [Thermodesulfobacteriota bacterium]
MKKAWVGFVILEIILFAGFLWVYLYLRYMELEEIKEFKSEMEKGSQAPHPLRMIAFTKSEGDEIDVLFIMSLDSGNITKIKLPSSRFSLKCWSPNGRYIALSGPGERGLEDIWILDLQTKKFFQLTKTPLLREGDLTFSPDGKKIAFSLEGGPCHIFLMNVDGTNLTKIVEYAGGPVWSPDGKRLAFEANWGEHNQIYIMDMETGNITQVTREVYIEIHPEGPPYKVEVSTLTGKRILGGCMPVFSPNGQKLLFLNTHRGLFTLDLKTGELVLLTPPEEESFQPGTVSNLAWSSDGKIYFRRREKQEKDHFSLDLYFIYCMYEYVKNIMKIY